MHWQNEYTFEIHKKNKDIVWPTKRLSTGLTLVGVVEPMKYPQACAHRDVATMVAKNNVARVGSSGFSVSQYDSTT